MDILLLELKSRSLQVMSNTFTNSRFLCLLIPRGDRRERNQAKYRGLSVKPWRHVRILRYLTWAIENLLDYEQDI